MSQNMKQLGQLRPVNTTPASIYSPASSTRTIVKSIIVCNVTGDPALYRIFHDDDGTTYDEDSALFWDIPIAANSTHTIEINLMANNSAGNVAVRTDTANAINFTLYGSEVV